MQLISSSFRSEDTVAGSPVYSRLEICAVAAVFIVFLGLELNNVFKGGAQGQDFYYHRRLTFGMAQHALSPILGKHFDPPLYYGVAAVVRRLFGRGNWTRAMGVTNVVFNLGALFFLYANARLMIRDQLLRLALICFVAFLPAFVITSAVICPDALTPLLILSSFYLVGRALRRKSGLGVAFVASTVAGALSILTKFTAISLMPAFLAAVVLFLWCRVISLRQAMVSSLVFILSIGGVELSLLTQHRESIAATFADPHKRLPLRNVLFFTSGDVELLSAPSHWHLALSAKSPSFALGNRYSYPALLCLGTFTDVLDFAQDKAGLNQEPTELYLGGALVGSRSPFHQQLMEIALKGGLVWFMAILLWLPIFVTGSIANVLRHKSRSDLFYLVVFLIGGAWLGFIASLLPLVDGAYSYGYWLPRLITPSIVLFLLLFFAGLGRIPLFGLMPSCVLTLAIIQSAIHIQFLWM